MKYSERNDIANQRTKSNRQKMKREKTVKRSNNCIKGTKKAGVKRDLQRNYRCEVSERRMKQIIHAFRTKRPFLT